MIWVGIEMTLNVSVQNRSFLRPFALRIWWPERTLTSACCPRAANQHAPHLVWLFLGYVAALIRRGLPPWCTSSRTYPCHNSFSKCSLRKPIGHVERLIQQVPGSCRGAHGPSSQALNAYIYPSTTLKSHMWSIRLLGKVYTPLNTCSPIKKKALTIVTPLN